MVQLPHNRVLRIVGELNSEIESDQRVCAPIEKASRKAIVLCQGQPVPRALGLVCKVRLRQSLDGAEGLGLGSPRTHGANAIKTRSVGIARNSHDKVLLVLLAVDLWRKRRFIYEGFAPIQEP